MSWPFTDWQEPWELGGLVIHTAFCGATSLKGAGKGLKNIGSISLVPGQYSSPVRKQIVIYVSLSVFLLPNNWAQIFILWYVRITLELHLGWYCLCMHSLNIASIILIYVPNIPMLSRTSIINWILNFIKRLFCIWWENLWFLSFTSYVVDYIY